VRKNAGFAVSCRFEAEPYPQLAAFFPHSKLVKRFHFSKLLRP
jgi:hypothetical protein